ncbi:MAG: GTP-binding protein [Paracoccaceae bacterium]|nr:GTP-binding protein [Paracoccaceae bacterium]
MPEPDVFIIGHVDHGKTTLAAAISSAYGADLSYPEINEASLADSPLTEYSRQKVGYSWDGASVSLLDFPGHADIIKSMIFGNVRPKGAILVVNVTDGPMPQTGHHLEIGNRVGIQNLVVFLNKTDMVNDDYPGGSVGFMESVERHIRELLSAYGYPGEETTIIAGSALDALEGRDPENGQAKINELLTAVQKEILQAPAADTGSDGTPKTTFDSELYMLTTGEGGRRRPFFREHRATFQFSSGAVVGTIRLSEGTEIVNPGDNPWVTITLDAPLSIGQFQRFVIVEEGMPIGAGVVSGF